MPVKTQLFAEAGTVRIFRHSFALDDTSGSHACPLEALACVCPMPFLSAIPLGSSLLLPVDTVNSVQILKGQLPDMGLLTGTST
jgi:hypothetical protein